MGHPAQYSGEKQGDSTENIYESKSEKKERKLLNLRWNKLTYNSICQNREFKIYNFYWGTLHGIVERSKEILLTTSMGVSQRRKKALEPPLKQINKQKVSDKAVKSFKIYNF